MASSFLRPNFEPWPTICPHQAVIAAGAQPSASSKDLTQLATDWHVERWVAIWNQPAGRGAGETFKNPKAAASKISLSTPGGPHEFLPPAS
jgi:hypothetical protein